MAGTWESQNKVIPGAYINILTNTPLSITAGERGNRTGAFKGRGQSDL